MRVLIVAALLVPAACQDLFLSNTQAQDAQSQKVTNELKALSPNANIPCVMEHCMKQATSCFMESLKGDKCFSTLSCLTKCESKENKEKNRTPGCAYLCEMTTGDQSTVFTELMDCMAVKDDKGNPRCMAKYPDDGECLATDKDAVQNITTLDQIAGDWWVVKGINCGQQTDGTPFHSYPPRNPTPGKNYPGGYDWYPCQHERFVKSSGHDFPNPTTPWVNNITYCGGDDGGLKECNTTLIDTVANITMCAPGVVCHTYTDAPLKPQFEHWRIISAPHPDWIASIWCGGTPIVAYNGGITLGRNHRSAKEMPTWVEENFRAAYKRFGVDWDQMCESTNEDCP